MSAASVGIDSSSMQLDEEAMDIIQEATSDSRRKYQGQNSGPAIVKNKFVSSSTIADPL